MENVGQDGNAAATAAAGAAGDGGAAPPPHNRAGLNDEDEQFYAGIREEFRPNLREAYLQDLRYTSTGRLKMRKIGDIWEVLAKVAAGLSTVLAFAAGAMDEGGAILSFLAGVFGTLSLSFMLFASYAQRQARERTMQLNILLEKVGIDSMPDTYVDLDGAGEAPTSSNSAATPGTAQQAQQQPVLQTP